MGVEGVKNPLTSVRLVGSGPILGLVLAACHPSPDGEHPDTGPDSDSPTEGHVDVLVVGGGPAGVMATVQAHASGARVLLLERQPVLGGIVAATGGSMTFAGTSTQAAAGVEDSPGALLEDWTEATGGDPRDPWVRQFAERSVPEVFTWYTERGTTFSLVLGEDDPLGGVPRLHLPSGGGQSLMDTLVGALSSDRVLLEHEVTGLLTGPGGVVQGVRAVRADGTTVELGAASVVLATGGFMRDLELVYGNRPALEGLDLTFACARHADGRGHRWLLEMGATWDNPTAVGLYLHGTPDPRPTGEGEDLRVKPTHLGIQVDGTGRRFRDESKENDLEAAEDALATGHPPFWLVVDAAVADEMIFQDPLVEAHETLTVDAGMIAAHGHLVEAATLSDLASAMGVDPTFLTASVDGFNAWARGESSDAWRTDPLPPDPIDEPPYRAVHLVPSLAKAFTGIDVDTSGRVLTASGEPIPGVYAAGELTGMAGGSLVGHLGFNGSFSAVLLSGLVAGRTAAEEALAR
ncbi:MAG: FAD-binding protein [Deltaproteobacteria bacterium]|nr:FAD-binding protein [Deltaproteobacteria bacterium]